MSIFKHLKVLALVGVQLLMFQSLPAHAQWPTLDISAIKEGIQSKIELVKQSKIVKDVTAQAGKLNSAIGDAKSSMSKFAGDNLQKAKEKAEKLQKEKKRLEKKKEKLEKAKEKAQKMKEKAEKAQKAMADAKKKVQEAKDKVNEAKEFASDVKSKVNDAKAMAADVKSTVADAKSMAQNAVSDAKSMVNNAKSMAQSTVSDVQGMANDVKSTAQAKISGTTSTMNGAAQPIQRTIDGSNLQTVNNMSAMYGNDQNYGGTEDSFVDDYVAAYEAGINSDSKIYERMPVEQGSYDMIPSNRINNSEQAIMQSVPMTSTGKVIGRQAFGRAQSTALSQGQGAVVSSVQKDLSVREVSKVNDLKAPVSEGLDEVSEAKAVKKLAKTEAKTAKESVKAAAKAEVKATRGASKVNSLQDSVSESKAAIATTKEKLNAAPVKSSEIKDKIGDIKESLSEVKAATPELKSEAVKSTTGFRQRAIINKDVQSLDKGAWLNKVETVKLSSYKFSETLAFGAEDVPDGIVDNGEYEETIMTETMLDYCGFGKDELNDVTRMQDCMKKIIKHKSDANNQIEEEGNAIYNKMAAELAVSVIGESLAMKNIAANYKDKLDKQDEDLASASTSRDDSGALAMTDKELQYVINKLLTIQVTMLAVTAMQQVGGIDYSVFEERNEEE